MKIPDKGKIMKSFRRAFSVLFVFAIALTFVFPSSIFAQSRPQKPDASTGNNKRNQRPAPKTEEELKKEEQQRKLEEEEKMLFLPTRLLRLRQISSMLTP
jgi:hypothetical protein